MMIRRLAPLAFLAIATAPALHAQATARISGVVYDSIRGAPLRKALVIATANGMPHDTVFHGVEADEKGRFEITSLAPGSYTLSIEHPFIDSTGITAPSVTVTALPGSNTAALALPSIPTLRRAFCPAALSDTTVGVMLGTVRKLDGTLAPNADVVFRWADFDLDHSTLNVTTKQVGASVKTDSTGAYRACGLPRARSIFVQAQVEGAGQSGLLEEQIGSAGVLLRDFHVSALAATDSAPSDVVRAPGSVRTYLVTGRVLDADGRPIGSAQVTLLGTGRTAATNEKGEFRLAGAPGGTQGMEVLSLGYSPKYLRAEVGDGLAPMDVRMEKTAVLLDSMRIVARRNYLAADRSYAEFESRLKTTQGISMTEETIKEKRAFESADLFMNIPGVKRVRVSTGSFPAYVIASTHSRDGFYGECIMDVYIDGIPGQPDDIEKIPPESLHGVEIFQAGTAPGRYNSGRCGAVLLWTKH